MTRASAAASAAARAATPEGSSGAEAPAVKEEQRARSRATPAAASSPCQVVGCDTSCVRHNAAYKRVKLCQDHLRAPFVLIKGQHLRFCQKCNRLQLLAEFEGGKRTCTRMLDTHNARRRERYRQRGSASAAASASGGGAESGLGGGAALALSPESSEAGAEQHSALEHLDIFRVDAELGAGVARGDDGVAGLLSWFEQRAFTCVPSAPAVAAAAALQPWQPAYLTGLMPPAYAMLV